MTPEKEREFKKLADKKAREEIRNATRVVMTDHGIDPHAIQRAGIEMARKAAAEAIQKITKSKNFEDMLRKIVREEMDKTLRSQRGYDGTNVTVMLKELIVEEGQKYAAEFIEKNIQLRLVGGEF